MKVLTVRQPWAYLIVNGIKDVENRGWATEYRGPLLIHAGKGMTREEYVSCQYFCAQRGVKIPPAQDLLRRGIVGCVTLVDCVPDYVGSRWYMGGTAWVLQDAEVLPFVPCPGRLYLFDVPYTLEELREGQVA